MSIGRLFSATAHAVLADYLGGIVLVVVGIWGGDSAASTWTGVVLGGLVLLLSLFTRYPLGLVKAIPFPAHAVGDYLGAFFAIIAPWALGFSTRESGMTAFYVIVGALMAGISLFTDYRQAEPTTPERAFHRQTHA